MSQAHPPQIGAFEILGELGRGGMGVVYRARHEETGQLCALKIIPPESLARPESALRFKREFRAMQRVQHPNVIRVYNSGTHDNCPFFTMEIVEGRDIRAWLDGKEPIVRIGKNPPPAGLLHEDQRARLNAPARVTRLSEAIVQVGFALGAIHSHRIVHRDLKPDNIMVSKAGVVKLMDFGIAKQLTGHTEHSSGGMVVGTFKYLSPEQALGAEVDGRADLYCLGIILYELLAGRHPFYSENSVGYAYHHARKQPPPIERFNPEVDPGLREICEKLIQKDPNDRFPTAEDVIAAIRQAVGGEHSTRNVAKPVQRGKAADLFKPKLIGRHRETGSLVSLCESVKRGTGRVAVVTGPAGTGKTRLIREVGAQARALEVEFIVGLAKKEDNAPYQPFVDVVGRIMSDVALTAPDAARNLLGSDGPVLARYLPSIRPLVSKKPPQALEPAAEKLRFMNAVSSLLSRWSTGHGRVICIEDLQYADELSLELARHLAEFTSGGTDELDLSADRGRFGIVYTIDPKARGSKNAKTVLSRLQRTRGFVGIKLGPLDAEAVREMLVTMIGGGDVAQPVGDVLHQATGGVPGMVEERIRAWAERGELRRQGRSWVLLRRDAHRDDRGTHEIRQGRSETASLPDVAASDESLEPSQIVELRAATRADIPIADVEDKRPARKRVARLSDLARDVAERIAVGGEQVPGTLIERICLRPDDELIDALEELIDKNVLTEDGQDQGFYRFTNPEQREVLLQGMANPERLASLHQLVGRALEEDGRRWRRAVDPVVLAKHHELGGEPILALQQLMLAARQALEASATQTAADLVGDAQALFQRELGRATFSPSVARLDADLVLLRLDVLTAVGEHKEVIALASRRLPRMRGSVDARSIAELLLRLAASERVLGNLDEALEHVAEALSITERGGAHSLRCRVKNLCGAIYARRGQYDRSHRYLTEALELARAIGDEVEVDRGRNALASRRLDEGDLEGAEAAFRELLESAEARGERIRVCGYVNALGVAAHERGDLAAAEEHYRRAIQLAKPAGDRRTVGVGYCNLGVVRRDQGRYDEALQYCARADKRLKTIDDLEMMAYVRIVQAQIYLEKDNAKKALAQAEAAFDLAERAGAAMKLAEASMCRGLALARLGRSEESLVDVERGLRAATEVDVNRLVLYGRLIEAEIAALRGDATAARDEISRGRARANRTSFTRFIDRFDQLETRLSL